MPVPRAYHPRCWQRVARSSGDRERIIAIRHCTRPLALNAAQRGLLRDARAELEARGIARPPYSHVLELCAAEVLSAAPALPRQLLPAVLELEQRGGPAVLEVQLHPEQLDVVVEAAIEVEARIGALSWESTVAAVVAAAIHRWAEGRAGGGSSRSAIHSDAAAEPFAGERGPAQRTAAPPQHATPRRRDTSLLARGGRGLALSQPVPPSSDCAPGPDREIPIRGKRGTAEDARTPRARRSGGQYVPISYRRGRRPKRGGGWREVLEPNPALKLAQQALVRELLPLVDDDPLAFCAGGLGPIDIARLHVGQRFVATADVKDFFDHCTADRVAAALRARGLGEADVGNVLRLGTGRGSLPQGAPSSPLLASLVLRDVDFAVHARALELGCRAGRWLDDFPLSGDSWTGLRELLRFLERRLNAAGFALNHAKTAITPRHRHVGVLGLCANGTRPTLTKGERRALRKKVVRAAKHGASEERLERLRGVLAYAGQAHPELAEKLGKWLDASAAEAAPGAEPEPASAAPRKRHYPRR